MWHAGIWRPKKVLRYLRLLSSFRRLLMVILHIWGGQPGRGPEITKLKHCATQQVPGNIFVFDGQVMIVTDLDKSRSIRGLGRKVARFVPERVGQIVVAYIAWILPFEEMLHDQVGIPGASESLSSYMWKDARKGAWETDYLSASMASLMAEHTGVELMVSDYRHIAILLARQIKGIMIRRVEIEAGEADEADDELDDNETGETRDGAHWDYIWDLQATHGTVIAAGHYALDVRFPNQLQPEKIAAYREISRLWHRFLEGWHKNYDIKTNSNSTRKRKTEITTEEVTIKKTKETKEIKLMKPTKPTKQIKRVKREPSAISLPPITTRDIQLGLERLLGSQARWKLPEQGDAMEAIMSLRDQQSLIVVLPTGSGKSILFLLPSLLENGTNIVVVPFAALMDDLVSRAREKGVDCIRWRPGRFQQREQPMRVAKMVVVSADMVDVEQFHDYVELLRDRSLLRRIFVDEAHTVILDASYRRDLERLKVLHQYDCPVVALTATLPGVMERWFRRALLLPTAPIIRTSTVKRNIRYQVVRVTNTGLKKGENLAVQEEVVRVILRLERTMSGDQKGVIYCRSKRACEALATTLGVDFYHGGMAEEARRTTLARWAQGEGGHRWIVATTGLGTGVDIAGIVSVVHMEQPYGLVDFVQQTGRGGRRDGEVVESVIIMDERKVRIDETRSDVEHLNHQAMEWFVDSHGCRRVVLGMFIDVGLEEGGQDCEQLQVERCDRCRSMIVTEDEVDDNRADDTEDEADQATEVDDGKVADDEDEASPNQHHQYIKQKHIRLRELRARLEVMRDHCPICVALWRYQEHTAGWRRNVQHSLAVCPKTAVAEYQRWRRQVRWGAFQCCWTCGLPQSFCDGWDRRGESCLWGDVMMPLVWWAIGSPGWQRQIERQFDVVITGPAEAEMFVWLGRSRRIYDEDMTNAIAVWDEVIR